MMDLLRVDTIFITVLGYPMSYVEFVGTVLYLASVVLMARKSMLTWPVGIVSVMLYGLLFYQIRLYADTAEQLYYLGASVYGWWHWRRLDQQSGGQSFRFSHANAMIAWACGVLMVTLLVYAATSRAHVLLPAAFPEPASHPFVDSLTTVMSFAAMWLLVLRRVESWIYWIVVDVIGIWLYFVKDVKFVSLLYVILLILAIRGFLLWRK
jgi:nicotinamide mononucleotide transporter